MIKQFAVAVVAVLAVLGLASSASANVHGTGVAYSHGRYVSATTYQPGTCNSYYEAGVGPSAQPTHGSGKWTLNAPPAGCAYRGRIHLRCGSCTLRRVADGGWVIKTGLDDAAKCGSGTPYVIRAAWQIRGCSTCSVTTYWFWPPTTPAYAAAGVQPADRHELAA